MTAAMWGWVVFCALVLVVLFVPPKYDPAIRLREWLDKKDEDRGS
jgi:hypothetical protein